MEMHIGHYRVLEKLGSGGMGVVYKAEDTLLKRIVALKFAPETALADENSKRRFLHEAQAASSLDHPNICSIHSIEETDDGKTFICMSWCEGSTLREILSHGRLDLAQALDIIIQTGHGIEAAHQARIVHRDIKPGNIMISPHGQAKILDFGIARMEDATRITKSSTTLGTVQYMSPEQVAGEEIDHRSDIWSLGIVLYETVTGKPPFTGDYEATVLYSIMNADYEAASKVDPAIPEKLDAVLRKALRKKPDERYSTIGDMIRDLEAIRSSLSVQPSERESSTPGRWQLAKKLPLALAAIAAAVVISLVLIGRFGHFTSHEQPRAAVFEFSVRQNNQGDSPSFGKSMKDRLADSKLLRMPDERMEREISRIDDFSSAAAFAEHDSVQFLIALRYEVAKDTLTATANVYDTEIKKWILSERASAAIEDGGASAIADTLSTALLEHLAEYPGTAPDWYYSRALENYRSGEELFLAGDPEASMPYFEKSLEYDSSFVETLLRLAVWESYAKNMGRARALAAKACSLSAGNQCLFARASIVAMKTRGEMESAASAMMNYLDRIPDDASMYLDLGYLLYRDMRSAREAIPYLRSALALDPDNVEGKASKAYDCLANANMDLGQYNEAESYLRKYLELMPNNVNALHSLASVSRVSGQYDLAIERYAQVIATDPAFFPTYDELCVTYLALGRLRDALHEIQSYYPIAQHSLHADAHLIEGRVYLAQGDYENAAKSADCAFAIDSLLLKTYWLRGRIALARGNIPSARDNLRAMIDLGARASDRIDSAYVHNLAGRIALAEGDISSGLTELQRSAAGPVIHLMFFRRELIHACLEAGQLRDAERLALDALLYNENDAEILYLLGSVYDEMGNHRNASKYYERAKAVWSSADEEYRPYRDLISKMRSL